MHVFRPRNIREFSLRPGTLALISKPHAFDFNIRMYMRPNEQILRRIVTIDCGKSFLTYRNLVSQ